jgi:hypothetical protein
MKRTETTRRRYLLAAGWAGVVGTAGCLWGSDGGGNSADPEFPSFSAGELTYRDWFPADETQSLGFGAPVAINFERYREQRSELSAMDYETGTGWAGVGDYLGIEFEEMGSAILTDGGPGLVYPGEFDRDAIDETLQSTGYEQTETRDDVVFYQFSDGENSNTVAVGNEGIIRDFLWDSDNFVDDSMVLFETARGERDRLHEVSERSRRYTDAVGWPLAVVPLRTGTQDPMGDNPNFLPEEVADSVVYGESRYYADGDMIDRYWVWTTEDGDSSPDDVREALDTNGRLALGTETNQIAIRSDDRLHEIAVIEPVEEPGDGEGPLQYTLRATVEDGTLRVTHRVGDPVPLDRLAAYVDGEEMTLGEGTLEPGNEVTLDVGTIEDEIPIIYTSPSGTSNVAAQAQ